MADVSTGTITIDTAAGSMEIAAGLPDWVTANLVEQANIPLEKPAPAPASNVASSGAQEDNTPNVDPGVPTSVGVYVQTPYGPVYVAPGQPDWVTQNQIQQLADRAAGVTTQPKPVAVPAPTEKNTNPVGAPPKGNQPGGLGAAAAAVGGVVARIAGTVGGAISAVSDAVKNITGGLLNNIEGVLRSLVPTLEQLALGAMSRFSDLASFIGEKVVDVETFAAHMASASASALSVILEDVWRWIRDALTAFMALLAKPAQGALDRLTANMLGPVL